MSRIEDEEEDEDELQRILEGRDVEEFREYNYRREDNRSDRDEDEDSNSASQRHEDYDHHKRQSQSKKQRPDDNRKKIQTKRRISSSKNAHNSQVVEEFTNEELNPQEFNVDNEKNDENVTKIKVKTRRIMKPRLLLNADKLMSKEGLAVLPQIFSDFKFDPKGSQLKDLNTILFGMSHWSHRLFPSLTFDDFIEKCEQLGNKRQVKNFVAKIRNDEPLNLDPHSAPLEDDPQDFEDFIEKDFDSIIANSYKKVTEDNPNEDNPNEDNPNEDNPNEDNPNEDNPNEELNTNDSESERQHFESDSLPSLESQLKSNDDSNQLKDSEVNDKQITSETDIQIDDPNEEELTEEQLLNEINCEDNTPFE